jgi:hypothetical protein
VPTLYVEYSTVGGDLWLRDYPPGVGPLADPWWSDVQGQDPCAVTQTRIRRARR